MAERKRIDEPTGTETVGHEWDGIEELDTPMPRWWLWTLYATIAWAVVYTVLYPAWPMISSATAGTTANSPSSRSRRPPWPGIRSLESFTPNLLLAADSARSPN